MNGPRFLEGAGIALMVALGGAAAWPVLCLVMPPVFAAHAIVSGTALVYLLYLIARTRSRLGKVVVLAGWALACVLVLGLGFDLLTHAGLQIGLIWLLRILACHRGVLAGAADALLCSASLAAATWAATSTGSVFLTVWTFLLVQASFVAIPDLATSRRARSNRYASDDDSFARANRAADSALRRLYGAR